MSEHLSDKLLTRYLAGTLTQAELLAFDAHLQACAVCQAQLAELPAVQTAWRRLQANLSAPAMIEHLPYETLAAYTDHSLPAALQAVVETHLQTCSLCTAEVEDLRALQYELAESVTQPAASKALTLTATKTERWRTWWQFSHWRWPLELAGATALGLLVAWFSTRGLRQEMAELRAQLNSAQRAQTHLQDELLAAQNAAPKAALQATPTTTTPNAVVPAKPSNSLTDNGARIALDQQSRLIASAPFTPAQQELIAAALRSGKIVLPATLPWSTKTPEVLLGPSTTPDSLTLRAPVGKVLLTNRPSFRWQALPGASSYRVTLFTANYEIVQQSPALTATNWTPPQALARDQLYLWQVTALKDGQEIKAPVAPAPEARFKVLAQAKADEINAARRRQPVSKLLLALLYAQAGLLDEAEQELQKLAHENPQTPAPQQLLRELRSRRRALNQ